MRPPSHRTIAFLFALAAVPSTGWARTPGLAPREATAVFAGGCFWGVEWVFEHVRGVRSAVAGFSGGTVASPSYEQVNSGSTGHAESVLVTYDPTVVSYRQLLEVFFRVAHDPTSRDRQGPDVGPDYRAIVFVRDDEERKQVGAYIAELTAQKAFRRPIVTEVHPVQPFYVAEAYHQHYAQNNQRDMYIAVNDAPKIRRLESLFPALYRDATTP
jgi:peptide-methionine (S)-S-oxide reductase